MIPKIHAKGASFRGAARYVLHDKGAETGERVAWTCTRNLSTDNPETAWRVMAATAMNAPELKRQAGVKNTGRKSDKSVLHFTLSWHADEAKDLTPEEQVRAADSVLAVMKATDRQALVVCHTDEPQPHVHVIVNRVSPEDGRMLASSFEKLKASRWAQKYEQERGRVFCPTRVRNNAARRRGEYVRGEKDEARHLYEQARDAGDDPQKKRALAEHKRRIAKIAKAEREQRVRHAAQREQLAETHRERRRAIAAQRTAAVRQGKAAVRRQLTPTWNALNDRQAEQRADFRRREGTWLGRMKNAFAATSLTGAFKALANPTVRTERLRNEQRSEAVELKRRQVGLTKAERRKAIRAAAEKALVERRRYLAERSSLDTTQKLERAATRTAWRQAGRDRRSELTAANDAERDRDAEIERLAAEMAERIAERRRGQGRSLTP